MLAPRVVRSLVAAAGVVLLVASCGGGGGAHIPSPTTTRSVNRTGGAWLADKTAVQELLAAARREIAATSTYDYRRLDRFRTVIRASTTAPLTRALMQTVDTRIARTGTTMHVVQTATVSEIGVGPMTSAGAATLLAVGQVAVHSTRYPNGSVEPFNVVASLRRIDGHWLLAALNSGGRIDGAPPGTPALVAASAAARRGLQALLTFHRASFAGDFARALAATTGGLRRQIAAERTKTLQTIRNGGFDLSARVRALAVESAGGDTITVLAQLDGLRIVGGRSTQAAGRSLHATLVERGGHWLLSEVGSAYPGG